MSNSKPNPNAFKSYKGFEEGSHCARKGRQCQIKKIHFDMNPPAVTVYMFDTQSEVGTEFDRLQHVNTWTCSMCTADNPHSSHKCDFCNYARTYKEPFTIHAPSQNNETDSVTQSEPSESIAEQDADQEEQEEEEEEVLSSSSESDEDVEQEPNEDVRRQQMYHKGKAQTPTEDEDEEEEEYEQCRDEHYHRYNPYARSQAAGRPGKYGGPAPCGSRGSRRPRYARRSNPFFGSGSMGDWFGNRWM